MLPCDAVLCLKAILEFKAKLARVRRNRVVDTLLDNAVVSEACRNCTPFARVTNVDLKHVADVFMGHSHGEYDEKTAADLRSKLRLLIGRHGVLVFPKQELSPQQQVAVHCAFGYHNLSQRHEAGYDQVDGRGEYFKKRRGAWQGVGHKTAQAARPGEEDPPAVG